MIAHGGCPPLFGAPKNNDDGRCDELEKEVEKALETQKSIKYVFIAARWEVYASNQQNLMFDEKNQILSLADSRKMFEKKFEEMLKKISHKNKYVIILTQVPRMSPITERYNDKIYLPITKLINPFDSSKKYDAIKKSEYLEIIKYNNAAISKICSKYKKTAIFYPENYMCDQEFCYSKKGDNLLYYDKDHINSAGGLYLGKFLNDFIPSLIFK